jgi:hypothetical protein
MALAAQCVSGAAQVNTGNKLGRQGDGGHGCGPRVPGLGLIAGPLRGEISRPRYPNYTQTDRFKRYAGKTREIEPKGSYSAGCVVAGGTSVT